MEEANQPRVYPKNWTVSDKLDQNMRQLYKQNYKYIIRFLSCIYIKYVVQYFSVEDDQKYQLNINMQRGEAYNQKQWFGKTSRSKVTVQQKYRFILELCLAMKQLTNYGILHTDLSACNIVLINGELRLIDFQRSLVIYNFYSIESDIGSQSYKIENKVLQKGNQILKAQLYRLYNSENSNLFERIKMYDKQNKQNYSIQEAKPIQDYSISLQRRIQKHFRFMVENVGKTNAYFFAVFLKQFFSKNELQQIDHFRKAKFQNLGSVQFQSLQKLLQKMAEKQVKNRMDLFTFHRIFELEDGNQPQKIGNEGVKQVQILKEKMIIEGWRYFFDSGETKNPANFVEEQLRDKKIMIKTQNIQEAVLEKSKAYYSQLLAEAILQKRQQMLQSSEASFDFNSEVVQRSCFSLSLQKIFEEKFRNSYISSGMNQIGEFKQQKIYFQDKFNYFRFVMLRLRYLRDRLQSQNLVKINDFYIFSENKDQIFVRKQHRPKEIKPINFRKHFSQKDFKYLLKSIEGLCEGVIALQNQSVFYPSFGKQSIVVVEQAIKIDGLQTVIPLISSEKQNENNAELSSFASLFFNLYSQIIYRILSKGQKLKQYEQGLFHLLFEQLEKQMQNKILSVLQCVSVGFKGQASQTYAHKCVKIKYFIESLKSIYKKHHSLRLSSILLELLDQYCLGLTQTQIYIKKRIEDLKTLISQLSLQDLEQRITVQQFLNKFTLKYKFCDRNKHQNSLVAYKYVSNQNHFKKGQHRQQFCDQCLQSLIQYDYQFQCKDHSKKLKYKVSKSGESTNILHSFMCEQCKVQYQANGIKEFQGISCRYLQKIDRVCMSAQCEDTVISQNICQKIHYAHEVYRFEDLPKLFSKLKDIKFNKLDNQQQITYLKARKQCDQKINKYKQQRIRPMRQLY